MHPGPDRPGALVLVAGLLVAALAAMSIIGPPAAVPLAAVTPVSRAMISQNRSTTRPRDRYSTSSRSHSARRRSRTLRSRRTTPALEQPDGPMWPVGVAGMRNGWSDA